ncbi:hypothetical protein GCM10025877_31280 [Agromyces mangrovi Wang et al. 2018]|nr:hypothetical protein GCM10025877_31280 [Agromyces mangrovi]
MSELSRGDEARYDLGLLFTDGMPDLEDDGGYRGAVAARAAGISYRQLDYWARTELVQPTVRGAAGSGTQRLYGFRDILVLKLVKRLLDTGISLQQIRTAVQQLREAGVHDLAQTTLMSDGASVYLCTSDDEVIDLVSRGQGCSASPSARCCARSRRRSSTSTRAPPTRWTNWRCGARRASGASPEGRRPAASARCHRSR